MVEIWRDVPGKYFYRYQVSTFGQIRYWSDFHLCWKPIKISKAGDSYLKVNLRINRTERKSKAVHRIVAETFLPKVEGKNYVNHIDLDKTNNCLDNLEWVTQKENCNHYHTNKKIDKHTYKINLPPEYNVPKRGRRVKCVETGEVFPSQAEAARKHYATTAASLRVALDDPNRMAYGAHWVSA